MNNSSIISISNGENVDRIVFLYFYSILWIGILSHIINIVVLISPVLKDINYKFMLANSVNNTFYLLLCGIYDFFLCPKGCERTEKPIHVLIYRMVIRDYILSCMAIFNLLIQIFLSLQRIFLVLNKNLLQNISVIKSILILASISLIFYSPILTIQRIELSHPNATLNKNTSVLYSIVQTEFGGSAFGLQVRTIVSSLRIILATVILTITNFINFITFKRYFDKRKKLIKVNQSKRL
jgi:hypothetical protein